MDQVGNLLVAANQLYIRNETNNGTSETGEPEKQARPRAFKIIGICLAISSGAFIGTSFVLKKVGLLRANEKYNEVAGEGYGYLKNAFWWSGMILMIVGEVLNFVAYAFTDAILVTPLGALSVVITTVLSAIFLKERLSMVGKVACFLCIVGSVVIVMNAPQESSVANIQQMQKFVIAPGFLSYTGVILIGSAITAFYAGPRWGKKNMLVYISICSWVGGLSVVATQGLGSAIVAQAQGTPQFNQWFLYVLLVFVIATLLTEIIFLNKALNLFNAAMVTPTYYVYFTSTTIITSAVLFRGFKGTAGSIVTVVMGFLTICSGVVLLQLSKSAKDVPDTAIFRGDLDQIHTIAEQEQSETEPKADAIRGTAALLRRFSVARQKMEVEELKRLHEEKLREQLEPVSEDGPVYEWDGLRRRKTVLGSQRSRAMTSPSHNNPFTLPRRPTTTDGEAQPAHPPLGMSHFPTAEELAEHDRPGSPGALSSIVGTIRSRARSVLLPGHPDFQQGRHDAASGNPKIQSPMHPVQLTEISVPAQKAGEGDSQSPYGAHYGLPSKTAYEGAAGVASSTISVNSSGRRVQFGGDNRKASEAASEVSSLGPPPTPPPHTTRRQFSFQNVFKRHQQHAQSEAAHDAPATDTTHHFFPSIHPTRPNRALSSRGYSSPVVKGATEEERLGLVKGDSNTSQSTPALQRYDESDGDDLEEEDEEESGLYTDDKEARYGRGITAAYNSSPPRRGSDERE
ncbi:magnesium transporter NIPA-domain-containing protein, partial [Coniochaeta sp. 2T2.1]